MPDGQARKIAPPTIEQMYGEEARRRLGLPLPAEKALPPGPGGMHPRTYAWLLSHPDVSEAMKPQGGSLSRPPIGGQVGVDFQRLSQPTESYEEMLARLRRRGQIPMSGATGMLPIEPSLSDFDAWVRARTERSPAPDPGFGRVQEPQAKAIAQATNPNHDRELMLEWLRNNQPTGSTWSPGKLEALLGVQGPPDIRPLPPLGNQNQNPNDFRGPPAQFGLAGLEDSNYRTPAPALTQPDFFADVSAFDEYLRQRGETLPIGGPNVGFSPSIPGGPGIEDSPWAARPAEASVPKPNGTEQKVGDSKNAKSRVLEFLSGKRQSEAEKRDKMRSELMRKRGQAMALTNIAEGLGSFKPSLAADYISGRGAPEQPEPFAEGPRLAAAEAQDAIGGLDMSEFLRSQGFEVGDGIKGSVLEKLFPALAAQQAKAHSSAESRAWRERSAFSERVSKFNSEANESLRAASSAHQARQLLKTAESDFSKGNPKVSKVSMNTAARFLLSLSGEQRFTDRDLESVLGQMGWRDYIDKIERFTGGEPTKEWLAEMNEAIGILEAGGKARLQDIANRQAAQSASIFQNIDPSYDQDFFLRMFSLQVEADGRGRAGGGSSGGGGGGGGAGPTDKTIMVRTTAPDGTTNEVFATPEQAAQARAEQAKAKAGGYKIEVFD